MEEFDFRFGKIAQLYYEIANRKVPCQMDLLDEWFPGLMILTDFSDGNTKTPAEYQELSYVIHAVKYHGRLYSGGSTDLRYRRRLEERSLCDRPRQVFGCDCQEAAGAEE